MQKQKYYAIAFVKDNDPATTYKNNPVCLFGISIDEVQKLKKYYIAFIEEQDTPDKTYGALAKEIGKKIGAEVEIIFTQYQPTVWQVKN